MYSVIQPIEVLDEFDQMVSTWIVLASDLGSLDTGNAYISDNIEEDMQEHTWVIKTSDILKFAPEVLQHLVIAFEDHVEPQPPGAE